MIRVVLFLLVVCAFAAGMHWLAERPGTVTVDWLGYTAETSVLRAIVIATLLLATLLLAWSGLRKVWLTPAALGRYLHGRRQKRGLDALSSGIIAIGAGDRTLAVRYANQARRALPNEPLTHLLRAQAAQIGGDRATARRIFEAMLGSPDTEQLGLRGLFLEAEREGEQEAARQFAGRALGLNPRLGWPVEALFDLQCKAHDWQGALDTLAIGRRQSLIDKGQANRRRAVLLAAQAQDVEDETADKALELALEAHRLAPDLVPASAIAGRLLAARGSTPRAARVLLKTWRHSPHPDLAAAYAYARPGDSPRDRLNRVRHLTRLTPHDIEGPIALAITAIEAREWDEARKALEPLLDGRLTQRVCTLMARIEGGQHGHTGRVREWFARAVNAPRDPAWTADGVVAEHWAPISPVTGALDAFRWRVPVEPIDAPAGALLKAKVEALVGLGAGSDPVLEDVARPKPAAAFPRAETIESLDKPDAAPERLPPRPAMPARPTIASDLPVTVAASRAAEADVRIDRREAAGAGDAPYRERPPSTPARTKPRTAPSRPRKADEPRIFISPRAPDDPGPEASETQDLPAGYPTSGAKA